MLHFGRQQRNALRNLSIFSLIDPWAMLRHLDAGRPRGLHIAKSRGLPHAQDVREFEMTEHGISVGLVRAAGLPKDERA